jgi:hypothetical protein
MPFCSRRCKLLDLGHWLDGDFRVPAESDDWPDGEDGGEKAPNEESET